MAQARRVGHGAAATAARVAVVLATVALVTTACAPTQDVRAVRRVAPSTTSTTTTTATTPSSTLPSAVPTTVPTPVVPVAGWSPPSTTLPPAGGFTSVSCISDVFCLGTGGGANEADASMSTGPGVVAAWDGATWAAPAVYFPAPTSGAATAPEVPGIACTGGPLCVVVDGSGHTSSGDGTTWSPPAGLPVGPGAAADPTDPGPGHAGSRSAAVACPSSRFCAYVDNTGNVATRTGTTWSTPEAMTARSGSATVELYQQGRVGVACADASTCTALVGGTVLDWNGSTWSASPGPWPAGTTGDSAISCPTPATCLAVRGSTVSFRTAGSGWSRPSVIDAGGRLDALSCPTAGFCVAADAAGNVVHLAGGTWSAPTKVVPTPVDYAGDGTSVSCPDDQFCLVLDGDGDYATYQGTAPAPGSTT